MTGSQRTEVGSTAGSSGESHIFHGVSDDEGDPWVGTPNLATFWYDRSDKSKLLRNAR
jgi:hypothetical protein